MDAIPERVLPIDRRTLELLWRGVKYPKIDQWTEGADWVYCPKELYVPVRRTRYAITVHDLYPLEPKYRTYFGRSAYRWHWMLGRALGEADLVLTVSEFTKRRLTKLTEVDERKIRVIGNGVEEEFFTSAQQPNRNSIPANFGTYILSVGGVSRKKGGVYLLAVAKALARIAPHITLVITGPVQAEFEKELDTASNIRLLSRGFPTHEMVELVSNAKLCISMSEYEGFGIPMLEAMAAGVPVIAAQRAALPEVVGDAGVIVDPEQSVEVAEVVKGLSEDDTACASLARKGIERAQRYRWINCVERLHGAFEEFSS